jgi:ATP-dependent RNA helicase DeaD
MAGFEDVHVTAPVAAELTRLGWQPEDPRTRELVAGASRGVNLVVELPPAAVHAQPLLGGLLSAASAAPARLLLVVPPASLDDWAEALAPLAAAAGCSLHVASGPARAGRLLREAPPAILLTTPVTALALARRSSLKLGEVTHLFVAWPELLEGEDELDQLLADLDKDAPRIIVTTQPEQLVRCAERFARRALTFPMPQVVPVSTNVRVAVSSHADRLPGAAAVLEAFDPAQVTLWTAAEPDPAIRRFAIVSGVALAVGDAEVNGLVVALDLPTAARLHKWSVAGEVVLLAPSFALPWLARVAPGNRPHRLPGVLELAEGEAAGRRAAIAAEVTGGGLEQSLIALAPLFERFEPAAVAAALYGLWNKRSAAAAPSAPAEARGAPPVSAIARLWVGVGKKDGASVNDLVGCLTREARVDRTMIGKVEVRESFSLVEVPTAEAQRIADRVTGLSIRQRRVLAKVDQGTGGGGERASRGAPRAPRRAGGPRKPGPRTTSGG